MPLIHFVLVDPTIMIMYSVIWSSEFFSKTQFSYWCVLRREWMGCWGLLGWLLLVMKWIIPENSLRLAQKKTGPWLPQQTVFHNQKRSPEIWWNAWSNRGRHVRYQLPGWWWLEHEKHAGNGGISSWNMGIEKLVGGDWNHGMDSDFPETVGNGIITPTDFHSIIFQRGRYTTNQLPMFDQLIFFVHPDDGNFWTKILAPGISTWLPWLPSNGARRWHVPRPNSKWVLSRREAV